MSIEVELKVGMIDMSLAQLLTSDHRIIEFPSILLPDDVVSGSIVRLSCARSKAAETKDREQFFSVQEAIRKQFTRQPEKPRLRLHNFTQTSVVLEWDQIETGSAELLSLSLLKNGQHLGVIPNPERRTSTKLSNLEIDKPYEFELVLSTSAGTFKSNLLCVHTQKMTDLSGLTVCLGSLQGSEISLEDIERTVKHIGCRPLQREVQLDTTHFICSEPDSNQYVRAQARNMPIVRPQWLRACEDERRLVEVRGYYLSEDPRLMPPNRPRAESVATAATGDASVYDESVHTEASEARLPSITVTDAGALSSTETVSAPTREDVREAPAREDVHEAPAREDVHEEAPVGENAPEEAPARENASKEAPEEAPEDVPAPEEAPEDLPAPEETPKEAPAPADVPEEAPKDVDLCATEPTNPPEPKPHTTVPSPEPNAPEPQLTEKDLTELPATETEAAETEAAETEAAETEAAEVAAATVTAAARETEKQDASPAAPNVSQPPAASPRKKSKKRNKK